MRFLIVILSVSILCGIVFGDTINFGSNIPLYLQLFDYNNSKCIKAFVTDSNNVPISGSPVSLSALGNGLYGNSSLLMPNTPYVISQFIVYDDVGCSAISTSESGASDRFILGQ